MLSADFDQLDLAAMFQQQMLPSGRGEQEGRILGRIIRYEKWGIQYEPDPVHAEMVIRELGLESAKPVATPISDSGRPEETSNIHDRLCPIRRPTSGSLIRSTIGAQSTLME